MFKKVLAFLAAMSLVAAFAAVDVNKATDAELDGIKGIGPVITKRITSERKNGEFKSWEDFITRVKGVGEKNAAKLSAQGLTVGGTAYTGPGAADAKAKADAKTSKKTDKTVGEKTKEVAVTTKDTVKDAAIKTKDAVVEKAKEVKNAVVEKKDDMKAKSAAKKEEKAETKAEAKAEAKADAAKVAASAAKK